MQALRLISPALVLFVAIAGFVFIQTADSSTDYGSEYTATVIDSSDVGTSSIKSVAGTIGSIVVASTSPVATAGPLIAFYQTSSTTVATTSMTALVEFGAEGGQSPTPGTYTFDVAFGGGIYMWVDPSFRGAYTLTYR